MLQDHLSQFVSIPFQLQADQHFLLFELACLSVVGVDVLLNVLCILLDEV